MTTNPYESPENLSNLPKPPTGWTTIAFRLFAVVTIVGLLVVLLLPFSRGPGAHNAARRMQCSNHLKQIGLALHNYHDYYGRLPPAYIADSTGKPIHSWRVLLLPYMEQKALYDKYNFNEPLERTEQLQATQRNRTRFLLPFATKPTVQNRNQLCCRRGCRHRLAWCEGYRACAFP